MMQNYVALATAAYIDLTNLLAFEHAQDDEHEHEHHLEHE
jgi:hypothetical protein